MNSAPPAASDEERFESTTGTVFGGGIAQAPYEAEYRDEWRQAEHRPLFTLANVPMGLPDLVRRWRRLEEDKNPFLELYGQTLRQSDLPARAGYLYLVQALEGLHTSEHRDEDERAQQNFEAERAGVLDELARRDLPAGMLRFIKQGWSTRRIESLDRRLRELIDQLPDDVRCLASVGPDDVVLLAMTAAGGQPIESLLRRLRNDLSHGNRNYADPLLRPWVRLVDTLCRAHALRLLGFDDDAIVAGLTGQLGTVQPRPADDGEPGTS